MNMLATIHTDGGRDHMPKRRESVNFRTTIFGTHYQGQIGFYPDGRVGEIFIGMEKAAGTALDVNARDLSVVISIALQRGATLEELLKSITRDENNDVEGFAGRLLLQIQEVADEFQAERLVQPMTVDPEIAELVAVREEHVAAVQAALGGMRPAMTARAESQMKGYTGDECVECKNFTMIRNGFCLKCDTCGATTGCS